MKRIATFTLMCLLTLGTTISTVHASSLDELIAQESVVAEQPVEQAPVVEQQVVVEQEQSVVTQQPATEQTQQSTIPTPYNSDYMDGLRQATDLSEPSAGATRINEGTKKICSFVVQVLSYFVVAALVVVVCLDLCYICIPFTRNLLAPGAAAMGGMQQPGMAGGMGSPMGGMGMGSPMGGMGMGGMGMGRYGGMGRMGMGMGSPMGGMGMGSPMGGMAQPGMAMGTRQLVTQQAINAVNGGQVMGPNGKPRSPLMNYASDMVILLVITPILFTLAVTGVLTDLGFLLGEILANAIASIGNMF